MQPFELVLLLIAAAVPLGMLAQWLKLPYPILLVVGGLLISLQPDAPRLTLDPQYVFVLVLPPLLYAGAYNTAWKPFRANLRSITLLAVGLTLFTTAAVAGVAHHALGMPWAVAFVLGAIVSPPDAVAALSVAKNVRMPGIVTTLLEGESLVNDAAALVAYRVAVVAVATGAFSVGGAVFDFLLAAFGGMAFGLAAGLIVVAMHRVIERHELADAKITITISLLTPFAIYVPAERLHLSGVLAVVVAGLYVGNRLHAVINVVLQFEARTVWEWIEFLLNSLVFILIGVQLPYILEQLRDGHEVFSLLRSAGLVTVTVIVTRVLWVFPGAYLPRWLDRQFFGCGDPYPPWQFVAVVAWTGMRGVVSLAAAIALPLTLDNGTPFPERDLIQFLTFWVIFATLVGQGLSLPLLIRVLKVDRLPSSPPETVHC